MFAFAHKFLSLLATAYSAKVCAKYVADGTLSSKTSSLQQLNLQYNFNIFAVNSHSTSMNAAHEID